MKMFHIRLNPHQIAIADLIDDEDDGSLMLTRIHVPDAYRLRGHGTTLLKQVITYSELKVKTLILIVSPSGTFDKQGLISWYQRHGFTSYDPARPGLMSRQPISITQESQ